MIPKWLLISLVPPILWAFNYHMDKIVMSRFGRGVDNMQMAIISGLGGILVIFYILVTDFDKFARIDWNSIYPTLLGGACYFVAMYLYYLGLRKEEVTRVAPLYSFAPIFGILFGVSILNEQISPLQILGILVVVAGGVLVDTRVVRHVFKVNWRVLVYISASCAFFALSSVGFKASSSALNMSENLTWFFTGSVITTCFVLAIVGQYREGFLRLFKTSKKRQLTFWMLVSNIIGNIGRSVHNYAVLLVPIAFVQTVEAFEAVFVLMIALFLGKFFRGVEPEDLSKKVLFQKSFSIALIVIGTLLITI